MQMAFYYKISVQTPADVTNMDEYVAWVMASMDEAAYDALEDHIMVERETLVAHLRHFGEGGVLHSYKIFEDEATAQASKDKIAELMVSDVILPDYSDIVEIDAAGIEELVALDENVI